MIESGVREKYVEAGRIAAKVRDACAVMVRPGALLLDVARHGEDMIRKEGGLPAFPINISLNQDAAHYTPKPGDDLKFSGGDVVKIDVGVHVDGYIGDTAKTVCLSGDAKLKSLVAASEDALSKALKIVRPGLKVSEIGAVIEDTITSHGFRPVRNLTGHMLERFNVHASPGIPNIRNAGGEDYALREGDVIAIEPFATDGRGAIRESGTPQIYSYEQERPVRMQAARKILLLARKDFMGLPFAKRWVAGNIASPAILDSCLRSLSESRALASYPVLRETGEGFVSQAEHTIIVLDKPIVTTK